MFFFSILPIDRKKFQQRDYTDRIFFSRVIWAIVHLSIFVNIYSQDSISRSTRDMSMDSCQRYTCWKKKKLHYSCRRRGRETLEGRSRAIIIDVELVTREHMSRSLSSSSSSSSRPNSRTEERSVSHARSVPERQGRVLSRWWTAGLTRLR